MAAGIGSRRLVVGAHYGLREWFAQRITAVILGAYTVLLLLLAVVTAARSPGFGYVEWAGLFAPEGMKVATLIAIFALLYHAWIGVRDIWMDYVKPTGVRIGLQVLTILWLAACAVWSVQILWRV